MLKSRKRLFDGLALSSMGKIMALKMDFHAIECQIVARLNLMLQCFFTLNFFEEVTFFAQFISNSKV